MCYHKYVMNLFDQLGTSLGALGTLGTSGAISPDIAKYVSQISRSWDNGLPDTSDCPTLYNYGEALRRTADLVESAAGEILVVDAINTHSENEPFLHRLVTLLEELPDSSVCNLNLTLLRSPLGLRYRRDTEDLIRRAWMVEKLGEHDCTGAGREWARLGASGEPVMAVKGYQNRRRRLHELARCISYTQKMDARLIKLVDERGGSALKAYITHGLDPITGILSNNLFFVACGSHHSEPKLDTAAPVLVAPTRQNAAQILSAFQVHDRVALDGARLDALLADVYDVERMLCDVAAIAFDIWSF